MRDLQPHIRCGKGDVSEYCIIVGDPGRVERVGKELSNTKLVSDNRGLPVLNGYYDGILITVACTGMGGPSAAIVIEELINVGAKYIIRIGSGGVFKRNINTGDLIISTGILKTEMSSRPYAPAEFPAIPDFSVLSALINSSKELKSTYHYGITVCRDAFYVMDSLKELTRLAKNGVIGSEMEGSILFTIAQLRNVRAGMIFYAGLNRVKKETARNIISQESKRLSGEASAIIVAFNAIKKLKGGEF